MIENAMMATMLALALPGLAPAVSRTYTIVYETDDAASAGIVRETLTIENAHGHTYVVLANANGAMATFPATLASDGEIENEPSEPALVCYNMAVSLMAERAQRPEGPLPLAIALGGRIVTVPLALVPSASNASRFVAEGGSGPALIDTRVDLDSGTLAGATLAEYSVAGSPARVMSRTSCTIAGATEVAPVTSVGT